MFILTCIKILYLKNKIKFPGYATDYIGVGIQVHSIAHRRN